MVLFYVFLGVVYLISIGAGFYCVVRVLRNQEIRMKQEFDTKMAMAQAQSLMKDNAKFEQLRDDIDYIISFYVAHDFVSIGDDVGTMEDGADQLIEQFVSSISAKTLLSMSNELKRQFGLYATIPIDDTSEEDFLTYFIRKEALTKVMSRVAMKRR